MAKEFKPAGTQWAGLMRHMEPAKLPPDASPDCENAFFYNRKLGLLGPRLGKVEAGLAEQAIVGGYGYHVNGIDGLLVATRDGKISFSRGYGSTPPGGIFSQVSNTQVAVQSTTLNFGFLQLIFNQFNQIIGGNAPNGKTAVITFSIPVFNSEDCTETYHIFTLTFTNGLLTDYDLQQNQAAPSNSVFP